METIENIVREMRKRFEPYAKSDSNDARYVAYLGYAEFADRIEAALEAERIEWRKMLKEAKDAIRVLEERRDAVEQCQTEDATPKESLQVENAAKMREALINVQTLIKVLSQCHADDLPTAVKSILGDISFRVSEALSAPPRNCDAFSKSEVLEELDNSSFSKGDTIEWLFDEAKGETDEQ